MLDTPVLRPQTTQPARSAPEGWSVLDYPGHHLIVQATTKWEREFRANACKKEPWTVAWIETMVAGQDVFWNIGANVGSYALIAASRGVYTVAVEPAYASYAALCNNVLANRLEGRVTPLCLAAADGRGVIPLAYRSAEAGAASHACGESGVKKSVGTLPTLALPLDVAAPLFGLPAPTHLLIDVDGAEGGVLRGAVALLADHVQTVMIECQPGTPQEAEIVEIMAGIGFTEARRFTERAGQPMGGIYYALYVRPGLPVPGEGAG